MSEFSRKTWRREQIQKQPFCGYCGRKVALTGKNMGTVDHRIPRSKGGTHHLDNLILCCTLCNNSKRDRTVAEWAQDILATVPASSIDLPVLSPLASHREWF